MAGKNQGAPAHWIVTAQGGVFETSIHGDAESFERIGADGYYDALNVVPVEDPAALAEVAARLRVRADEIEWSLRP